MTLGERAAALEHSLAGRGVDWESVWWIPASDALHPGAVRIATNRLRNAEDPALPATPWQMTPLTVWQRGLVVAVESAESDRIDTTRFALAGWGG